LDLEFAGEFLTMAATLLKLKSDLVLEHSTNTREAEAERSRLVRQLLEYKRIRDLATLLAERYDTQALRHGRPGGTLSAAEPESDNDTYLEEVSLVDLYRVYHRIHGEVELSTTHTVDFGGKSVREYVEAILHQLMTTGRVDFTTLVGPGREKGEVIGNFLALLEMVKQHEVNIEQDETGEIFVTKHDEEE
ncbi:MAG: segregation/condensation protein A, partial [Nitrospira sp.]|nr:segregation/condensation protein A [Nitrospira sp.]